MRLEILDSKTIENNKKWYLCKGKLSDYIAGLKADFYSFEIQRKIVKNQYLDSLLETILNKEPIPVITLTSSENNLIENNIDLSKIEILDGLQRSYRLWIYFKLNELYKKYQVEITRDKNTSSKVFASKIKEDDICSEFIANRTINSKIVNRLCDLDENGKAKILSIEKSYSEFDLYFIIWENLSSNEIIKKMLILNAGQSPVTRSHQYELLFLHYLDSIRSSLNIVREKENNSSLIKRGSREIGTFLFSSIILSLESFVAQRAMLAISDETLLKAEENFDSKDTLALVFDDLFLRLYSKELLELDKTICKKESKGISWFVKDTTLSGFWGAVGNYIKIKDIQNSEMLSEKFTNSCNLLGNRIRQHGLNLDLYEDEYNTLSSRTINIGSTVRQAVFSYISGILNNDIISWKRAFARKEDNR